MLIRNTTMAIPGELAESELQNYLDNLVHEGATRGNSEINSLD